MLTVLALLGAMKQVYAAAPGFRSVVPATVALSASTNALSWLSSFSVKNMRVAVRVRAAGEHAQLGDGAALVAREADMVVPTDCDCVILPCRHRATGTVRYRTV
jgi:hypothetical protein